MAGLDRVRAGFYNIAIGVEGNRPLATTKEKGITGCKSPSKPRRDTPEPSRKGVVATLRRLSGTFVQAGWHREAIRPMQIMHGIFIKEGQ